MHLTDNTYHLSSMLNAQCMMYEEFVPLYPHVSITYCTYNSLVKKMKISFAKLGQAECETCLEQISHQHHENTRYNAIKEISDLINVLINDVNCRSMSCQVCYDYEKHLERAIIARSEYMNDSNSYIFRKDETIQSVDMQKVIMLTRMPGVKRAVFTKRIVAFNITFAPLGGR